MHAETPPLYPAQGLPAWRRVLKRVGKRVLAWRYRHFTPESRPDSVVRVAGLRLRVLRGVFDPSMHFTSGVLARYLMKPGSVSVGSSVLDLGTGTGIAAIAAARAGARHVVAIDINPAAIESASLNVQYHGLGDVVEVLHGDMFSAVGDQCFDLVVCNPPYFRGEPANMAERAYHAGPELEWLHRFGTQLADQLTPNGSAIISIGDAADINAILSLLAECGWASRVVAKRDILVEAIYLFRLTRSHRGDADA